MSENELKTENYTDRLRKFEAGSLGDDEDWFDWLFVWEAWKKYQRKRALS